MDENKETGIISPFNSNPEADEAVLVACKMLDAGVLARQPRFNNIKRNEDMYNGFNPPALKGRSNIPFDTTIMRGYIDTLIAGTDQPVDVTFERSREQDLKDAQLQTAVWRKESQPSRAAWNYKIQDSKKLAALSGRAFLKLFVSSSPKFSTDLEVVDHYDVVTEALGGGYLDKHLYKFQMNIFRTKEDLMGAAQDGFYDKMQVRKLIFKYNNPDLFKTNLDIYKNKNNRFLAFGIDIEANAYVGQNLYRLVEGAINFKGKWKYILFNYETKTWVRYEPLEEVFSWAKEFPGRGALTSWATHRDPFIFWSQAPADDIRPFGYSIKKIMNLTIDNLEKRNWDMKIYNPKMFTDPSQFLWKQDGLIKATLKQGETLQNGFMQMTTPDTAGITVNLVTFLDTFLGQKTGITGQDQGSAGTDKVGIAYVNLQATGKRLTLHNNMFEQCLTDLAVMFDYGISEHLREPYAVQLIGNDGISWEEKVTNENTQRDFKVIVKAGNEDEKKGLLAAQKKDAMITKIVSDPDLKAAVNKKWLLEHILESGELPPEEIHRAMDTDSNGDSEMMAEAADSISKIIQSKKVKMNYGATTGFVQKILDYATDNEDDMSDAIHSKLVDYANAHIPIATKNMTRKIFANAASSGMIPPPPGAVPGSQTPPAPQDGPQPPQMPDMNSTFNKSPQMPNPRM